MNIKVLMLCAVFVFSCLAGEVEIIKDVVFGKGVTGSKEIELKLDIARPKGKSDKPLPVVVLIFGGGWGYGSKESWENDLKTFANNGYFCIAINYRLAPKYKFPAQIEDCKCAVRFLRAKAKEYNIDPDLIACMGYSAGGHLSALMGTSGGVKELEGTGGWAEYSSNIQAVIDYCGPTDIWKLKSGSKDLNEMLVNFIGKRALADKEKVQLASPVYYAGKNNPPFLIIHGEKDPLVPVSQARDLEAVLKAAGVEVVLTVDPNGVHGGYDVVTAALDFLGKHFKAR